MDNLKTPWIYLIGMGADGIDSLSVKAKALLESADILVSSQRLFDLIPQDNRHRIIWQSPLSETLPAIESHRGKRVAIIATGDPLNYGVGSWLLTKFALDEMLIVPGISSHVLACARMGWTQQNTQLLTLHGRDQNTIRGAIAPGQKLVVLSEDAKTPGIVCQHLIELGYGNSELVVFAHMDGKKEQRFDCLGKEGRALFDTAFEANPDHDLNVITINCKASSNARVLSRAPGLDDAHFANFSKLSKRDMRALAISKLAPQPGDIFWDVGAGSASIAVEFLRLAPRGKAFTFDHDASVQAFQDENAQNFGLLDSLKIGGTTLPNPKDKLAIPNPDALFIGGGVSMQIIDDSIQFLKSGGRLVAHAVTLESETILATAFAKHGGEMSRISVARLDALGKSGAHGFRPAMSITQWCWQKDRAT